jgi:hypothetical protein
MKRSFFMVAILFIATIFIASCAPKNKVVEADTGKVVDEGNKLPGESYYVPKAPVSTKMGVTEYTKGGMTYLVIETSQGLCIVNYTLDSIELSFHEPKPRPLLEEEPKISNTQLVGVWRTK